MRLFEDWPQEIPHTAHNPDPAHKLKLVKTPGDPFKCDGCKEPGDGPRYTCNCRRGRSFDLHPCCAIAEPTLTPHLFGGSTFKFLHKPTGHAGVRTICDARGDYVWGFMYHRRSSDRDDLDLHPCCATLRATVVQQGYAFELCKKASHQCLLCGSSGKYWAYYDGSSAYIHVACLKKIALNTWEQAFHNSRSGGGGCIIEACMPIVERKLQSLPRNEQNSSSGFDKIVGTVVRIIIGAIVGNPMGVLNAIL